MRTSSSQSEKKSRIKDGIYVKPLYWSVSANNFMNLFATSMKHNVISLAPLSSTTTALLTLGTWIIRVHDLTIYDNFRHYESLLIDLILKNLWTLYHMSYDKYATVFNLYTSIIIIRLAITIIMNLDIIITLLS